MRRLFFILCVGLIGTAILVSLALWQWQRLQWKTDVLAQIEARIAGVNTPLPSAPTEAAHEYAPVEITGTFAAGAQYVLTSQPGQGAGYRVLQPLVTDGRTILVDRGFIPAEERDVTRPLKTATVQGNLLWPDEMDAFTPAPDLDTNLWFARDLPAMAKHAGTDPILVVLRSATPRDSTDPQPWPVDTSGIPNNHLQYVITWVALAVVWVAMSFYFLRRTRRSTKG